MGAVCYRWRWCRCRCGTRHRDVVPDSLMDEIFPEREPRVHCDRCAYPGGDAALAAYHALRVRLAGHDPLFPPDPET
jgi:hypothetical protein